MSPDFNVTMAFFQLAARPACHGCPFLNAAVDFPEVSHPGHAVAIEHKNAVRARFRQLAVQAGAPAPGLLADHLLLLMDGVFISIRMYGAGGPAMHVVSAVAQLLAE